MHKHRDLSRRAEARLIHGREEPRSQGARDHATRVLATLEFLGAPLIIRQLCLLIFGDTIWLEPVFDMVEMFAGEQANTTAHWCASRLAIPFELLNDEVLYNMLGTIGFIHALRLVLSLRIGFLRIFTLVHYGGSCKPS
jgi:hypothetical protein